MRSAEAGGFTEATVALSAWVVQGKAQLAERALSNENDQGPDPAPGPAPGIEVAEPMNAPQPRHAWEGPYVVNGVVARPVASPKVLAFYGIPAVAARARDRQQNRMNFHVTFNSIHEVLLKGKDESVLFTAEQLAAYMRQRAILPQRKACFTRTKQRTMRNGL